MRERKCKKYSIFIMIILVIISFSSGVNMVMADAYHNDLRTTLASSYSFKTTNYSTNTAFRVGVKGWSSGTPYKGIGSAANLNAYCVSMNHKVGFTNGTSYTSKCVSSFIKNYSKSRQIIAGYIVELINADNSIDASDATMMVGNGSSTKSITSEKDCKSTKGCDWSSRKEYAYFVYKVLTLNTYFSKFGVTGSIDFTKVNTSTPRFGRTNDSAGGKLADKISQYITKAKEKYQSQYASSTSLSLNYNEPSSKTLIKSGNFYITSVPFSNNTATKLANGTTVTNSVTGSGPSGSVVYFCTDRYGKNCSSTAAIGTNYYIKVVPGSTSLEGGSVKITVSTSANFQYPRLLMYCRTKNTKNQAIGVHGLYSETIGEKKSFTLSIPKDTTKTIEVAKVDQTGESIAGAEFKLIDSSNKEYSLSNSDGKKFTYTINDPNLDFSNLTFTLKEIKTPNGYIAHENINNISIGSNEIAYYKKTDGTGEDEKISINKYASEYKCKVITTKNDNSTTEYKDLVDDGCDSWIPSTEEEPSTQPETPSTEENNETKNDSSDEQLETVTSEKVCIYVKNDGTYDTSLSLEDCDKSKYYKIDSNGNYVFIEIPNSLNSVKINKVDVTGKEEVPGAELKICTKSDYDKNKNDCKSAKTVNDVEMSWTSGLTSKEFSGLPVGDYYIIETVPPLGYKLATTITPFSIDEKGVVKTGDTVATDNTIVIDNSLNEISISKTDIVTSKELPGAVLSICEAVEKSNEIIEEDDDESSEENNEATSSTTEDSTTASNDDIPPSTDPNDYTLVTDEVGDCVPVVLQDGSGQAVWISEDKPHKIQGIPTGTYYLVEKTAPRGYATTESILFKMTNSGQITDIAGNPIKDNKIVMKDKSIEDVKTGKIVIAITILFAIAAGGLGIYYYTKTTGGTLAVGIGNINDKIRKRKIHK